MLQYFTSFYKRELKSNLFYHPIFLLIISQLFAQYLLWLSFNLAKVSLKTS